MQLTGVLDIQEVQQEVTWKSKPTAKATPFRARTLTINFSDFDITPPTFQGLVSISEQATLQVQLIAELA